ncbi:hypothetical protein HS7_16030 [Sulfolobales archaeon HS-7]|nr:hypothetical protein HS7_16030 [Sulfolobales archaeon HS-7]
MFLILIIVSPVFLSLTPGIVKFSGYSYWDTQSQVAYPGQKNIPLTIVITYIGTNPIYNVTFVPVNSSPLFLYNYSTQPEFKTAEMTPGENFSFTLQMEVSKGISGGTYDLKVYTYFVNDSIGYVETVQIAVKVSTISFSVSAESQTPLYPGEKDVPITMLISNLEGDEVNNLTVYLTSTYPIRFYKNEFNVTNIPPFGTSQFTVLASVYSNTTLGYYQMPITLSYSGNNYSTTYEVLISNNLTVFGKIVNANFEQSSVGPYEDHIPVSLVIDYLGGPTLSYVNVNVFLPEGFTNVSGGDTITLTLTSQGQGVPLQAEFFVNTGNVTPGYFTFPVSLNWYVIEGEGEVQSITQSSYFSLFVTGTATLNISGDPQPLEPLTVNQITFYVNNRGDSPVYNVTITPQPVQGISFITQLPEISEIPPGKSVLENLSVYVSSELSQQPVEIPIVITYNTLTGQGESEFSLGYYVEPIIVQTNPVVISLSPFQITSGVISSAYVTVENNGSQVLKSVSIQLSSQETSFNSTVFSLDVLNPGQKVVIPLTVYTSIEGSVIIQYAISFYNIYDQIQQESGTLSLLSAGLINISISSVSVLPSTPTPGSLVSLTATIVNYGTGVAQGLLATYNSTQFPIVGGNTYYVGNLGPDSPSTFTFAFTLLNSTQPGTYRIPVILKFTNSLDQVKEEEIYIPFTVYSPAVSSNVHANQPHSHYHYFFLLILLIVIIAIIAVAVFLMRRRK